jgi:hypothetical protein
MPGELRGWQRDPYGVHELRYFTADGKPSRLVRDGDAWSKENPPFDFHFPESPVVPPLEPSLHYPAGAEAAVTAAQSSVVDPASSVWEQSPIEQTSLVIPADWHDHLSSPGQLSERDGLVPTQHPHPAALPVSSSARPLAVASAELGMAPTDASDIPTTSVPGVSGEQRRDPTTGIAPSGRKAPRYRQSWTWMLAGVVLVSVFVVVVDRPKKNADTVTTTTTHAAASDSSAAATTVPASPITATTTTTAPTSVATVATATTTPVRSATSAPPTSTVAASHQVQGTPVAAKTSTSTIVRSSPATTSPATTTTTGRTQARATTITTTGPATTTTGRTQARATTTTTAVQSTTSTTVAPTTTTSTTGTSDSPTSSGNAASATGSTDLTAYPTSGSSPSLTGAVLVWVLFGAALLLLTALISRRRATRRRGAHG